MNGNDKAGGGFTDWATMLDHLGPVAENLITHWERPDPSPEERQRMVDDISQLRSAADVVVVSYHWGVSGSTEVAEYQRELAHAAINAGADLVMGHGPHVFQPVEIYKGRPILFSLANFSFDYRTDVYGPNGLMARVVVEDGEMTRLSLVPLRRDERYVYMLDPNEAVGQDLYQKLVHLSPNTTLTIEGKEIVVGGITTEALTGQR